MAVSIVIPDLGYGMVEATVVAWLIEVGNPVKEGEALLTIETDKVTTEVLSPAKGTLIQQGVAEGDVVTPMQVVGSIGVVAGENTVVVSSPASEPVTTAIAERSAGSPVVADPKPPREIHAAPVARQIAKEHGIDLQTVEGTGPGGRITKADVLRVVETQSESSTPEAAPTSSGDLSTPVTPVVENVPSTITPAGDDEIIPMTGVRKAIAERLSLSRRTAADVTTIADVEMGAVKQFREQHPASYTAYVVRATALALRAFPIVNSTLDGDRIIIKKAIHIGVAVAAPHGLVVPVIRNADQKPLAEIAESIKAYSAKAQQNRLTLQDFADGTFTVSNSGTFGSLMFTPIINHPQTAILGMGKIFEAPIVHNHQLALGWMMYLSLSYDHRVIDGAPAVQFLQEIKRLLERPWELADGAAVRG